MTDAPTTPSPERQPADAGGGLLPADLAETPAIRKAIGLFRSVILCGEPWTKACQEAYFAALQELDRLAALSAPAPQAQPDARAVEAILRQHIRCDATGLAPAVASVYLTGFEEAAKAVSLLSAPAADDGWRPIESAPKDGTVILVANSDGIYTSRRYAEWSHYFTGEKLKGWVLNWNLEFETPDSWIEATHWRPLPAAPTDVEERS